MARPGQWGDGVVLAYACKLYNRQINILMTDGTSIALANHIESSDNPLLMGYVKSTGSTTENHYVHLEHT